jgi:hypothetical protein
VTIRNFLTLTRSTNPAANAPLPVWMGSTVCPKPYSDQNKCADWIAGFVGPAAGFALSKEANGFEVLVSGHLELKKFFQGDAYVHIKNADVLIDCDGDLIGWLKAGLNIHNDVDSAGRWELKYSAHLSSEQELQSQIAEIETLVGASLDSVFDAAVSDLNSIKAALQTAQANLAQLQTTLRLCQVLLSEVHHIWDCGTSVTCQANYLACQGFTVALPPMIQAASAGISTVMQSVQGVETGATSIEQAVNSARDMVQKMQITGIKCEGVMSSIDVTCNLSLDVAVGGQTVTVPAGDVSAAGIAKSIEKALCASLPVMKC